MRFALPVLLGAAMLPAQAKLAPVTEASYAKIVAAHKGRVAMVDFWATFCVPCRAEMPQLAKMAAKYAARGVDLVTVSADESDKESAALQFLAGAGVGGPFYIKRAADDDKFATLVDAKWSGELPALFLYDRAGKKAHSFLGDTPMNQIEAALQKLLQ
jgi:thiol-disulfide isomerase/thioredoxin